MLRNKWGRRRDVMNSESENKNQRGSWLKQECNVVEKREMGKVINSGSTMKGMGSRMFAEERKEESASKSTKCRSDEGGVSLQSCGWLWKTEDLGRAGSTRWSQSWERCSRGSSRDAGVTQQQKQREEASRRGVVYDVVRPGRTEEFCSPDYHCSLMLYSCRAHLPGVQRHAPYSVRA